MKTRFHQTRLRLHIPTRSAQPWLSAILPSAIPTSVLHFTHHSPVLHSFSGEGSRFTFHVSPRHPPSTILRRHPPHRYAKSRLVTLNKSEGEAFIIQHPACSIQSAPVQPKNSRSPVHHPPCTLSSIASA